VDRSPRSSGLYLAGVLAPLGIVLVVIALTTGPAFSGVMSDLRVYFDDSGRLLGGGIPYREFALEYPPLALVPMTLPRLVRPLDTPTEEVFVWSFAIIAGCLAVVIGMLIATLSEDPLRAIATWALLVAAAGASIAWRYDLWPAAAVLAALAAAHRGRPGMAGVALGAGTMLKLFPIVVLPILAARSIAMRDWAGLRRLLVGTVLTIGLVMAVTLATAGGDALQWLTYELDRGLQLESSGSGILLLLHVVAGQPFALALAFGTLQVVAPGADLIVRLTPFLEALLVAVVSVLALLRFRRDVGRLGSVPLASLATGVVAVLVALIVASKVFSVQYIVWFLPLAPFLPGRLRWTALAIALLSTLIYPLNYAMLWQLDPLMAVVLNVRNGLLSLFLASLAARLATAPA
jgi:hypothetical protein